MAMYYHGNEIAVGDIDDTPLSKGGIAIVDAATRAVVIVIEGNADFIGA